MNMNEKQMEQDFKKFVGALFGIDTDNLDVNVQKTENGTTISASTKTEESSDEAKNLSQSLKNKLDKFGFDTTKKDELVNNGIDALQTVLGTVVNVLGKAITSADSASKGLEEKRPTTEPTDEKEESSVIDAKSNALTKEGNPVIVNPVDNTVNSRPETCVNLCVNAKTIKEALRKKLETEKKNEKLLEKFYGNVIESTNGFIAHALETGDYSPITDDLEAEEAGISISVSSKSFVETIINLSVPMDFNKCEFKYEEDIFKDMVLEGLEKATEMFGFDECLANLEDDENGEGVYTFFLYF